MVWCGETAEHVAVVCHRSLKKGTIAPAPALVQRPLGLWSNCSYLLSIRKPRRYIFLSRPMSIFREHVSPRHCGRQCAHASTIQRAGITKRHFENAVAGMLHESAESPGFTSAALQTRRC